MINPQNAAELVLQYHCEDSQYAAALVMEAINNAGYVVLNRKDYIEFLTNCAAVALEVESRMPLTVGVAR
jgi:hypothetical protein